MPPNLWLENRAMMRRIHSFRMLQTSLSLSATLWLGGSGHSSAAEPDHTLPKGPPDWRVDVVAEPPQLVHPSTVCVAPDGRVFVAQDPVDMGAPSDSLSDSILCFHPDGKVTRFAEKLHAVFGLAYLDGKLYVHHTPDFSAFTDDNGIGKDRTDLFTTNPNPNDKGYGFNDHIPSNMRLGMDGWFYMSTGDKGIYGAVGRDGSKVNLEGGGIMRFRPDGTHLEIYANGTRNHLDVAINAEDEIFTYDNTDDGNGWWTRVTHMVDGGFYGYPYHYKPRRPYTLWMMKDYGGGSPTGAIAYNEDALPDEYRGNVFLSEWGRQQFLRLKVQREGATFQVESREQVNGRDFLSAGTKPFRPNGIAVSPDGLSFYIADWNYGGWKANVVAGRLLKVTYTGPSLATPKPGWWVAAAMGKPFQAETGELIAALKHPAQSVRLVAQRRLADRGQPVVPALAALLLDRNAPAHARWHAIWTLDAIDQGTSARGQILSIASTEKDLSVRGQAIRQLGTRAAKEAVAALTAGLKHADATIRFRSATALGRIGDAATVAALLQGLDEQDLFARYAAFTALKRIGSAHPFAWNQISAGLENSNPAIREGTLFAMRETFQEENVRALSGFVSGANASPESRAEALAVLAELHHQPPPWAGRWWATQPVKGSPPAKTVEWPGSALVRTAVRQALSDPEVAVRRAAVAAVALAMDLEAAPRLRDLFTSESDVELRRAIIRALGDLKDGAAAGLIANILGNPGKTDLLSVAITSAGRIGGEAVTDALVGLARPSRDAETLALVIPALGKARSQTAIPALARLLRHSDSAIRTAAGQALAETGGPAALQEILPLLDDSTPEVQKAAINAAGLLRNKTALPKLLELSGRENLRQDALLALARIPDATALDPYLAGLGDRNTVVRDAARRALEAIRNQVLPEIERRHQKTPFRDRILSELQRVYTRSDAARKGPLFEGEAKPSAPDEYGKYADRHPGMSVKGKQLFEGPAGCVVCHRVAGKGGDVGPDLAGIASKYNRGTLIESILYPSKQIFEGYKSVTIATKDGESYNGLIREENEAEVVLVDSAGARHKLRKDQFARRVESELSLMPEGLQATMSLAEFADLVAYLESLKQP